MEQLIIIIMEVYTYRKWEDGKIGIELDITREITTLTRYKMYKYGSYMTNIFYGTKDK